MEMKSRVVHLFIDVNKWNMVAIIGLGRIQVKGEIIRILIRIRHENFRDQEQTGVHSQCTY